MSGVPYLHLHAVSTNEPSCLSVILSLKSGKLSEGYYVVTESLFSYPPVTNPSDLPCHLSRLLLPFFYLPSSPPPSPSLQPDGERTGVDVAIPSVIVNVAGMQVRIF